MPTLPQGIKASFSMGQAGGLSKSPFWVRLAHLFLGGGFNYLFFSSLFGGRFPI